MISLLLLCIWVMIYKDLRELSKEIKKLKNSGKKIVWTNGCFDIMHPWHMETFNKCRELWDIVVVGMNGDISPYWKTKPWRPIHHEDFRSKMLDNLKNVDYVYIFNDETPVVPVQELQPDYVLKGWDYIQESIRNLVKEKNGIVDLTDAYHHIIHLWIEPYRSEKWFMPEGEVSVRNGKKVVSVPVLKWYSTTAIINKIRS